MADSMVWQCAGCERPIGPDDDVIEFIEHRYNKAASLEIPIPHFAHIGHGPQDVALGHLRGRRGTLRELRARVRGSWSP